MSESTRSVQRDQPRRGPRRGRTWLWRLASGVLVVVVLAAVSWWLFRAPITRAVVLSRLEAALGAPVSADHVELLPDGSIVLRGVVLRTPTARGPAADVLQAERLSVFLELTESGPAPRRVEIDRPLFRISRDSGDGSINLLGLVQGGDASPGSLALPEIEITEGILELGEHAGEAYQPLKSVPLVGEVVPLPGPDGEGYSVRVRTPEGLADSLSVPLEVSGQLSEDGIELSVDRVRLQEWVPQSVPSAYRELVDSLGLAGDVERITFASGFDGGGLRTTVALNGVRMRLPVEQLGSTPEDAQPLIASVRTGRLELSDDGLRATMDATAAGVPLSIEFDHRGTGLDAPFDAEVAIRAYALPKDPPWLGHVPEGVQRRLKSFDDPTGVVDADVRISRASAGEQPQVEGEVRFRDVVARFDGFPYRMRSVSGQARFDRSALVLEEIRGASPSGARLEASGRIEPPGRGAKVALDITASGVPMDEDLREALGPERVRLVDGLFHRPSFGALNERGLIEEGFELGGRSDITVSIRRAFGLDSSWERDIRVTLDSAGLVTEAFPLPVIAEDVEIVMDGRLARINQGRFVPTGGRGRVTLSAEVDLERAERPSMWISLDAADMPVNDQLVFAVSNAGAVQEGAELLTRAVTGLRLGGLVDCSATISTGTRSDQPGGDAAYDVRVDLRSMRALASDGGGDLAMTGVEGFISANNQRAEVHIDGALDDRGTEAGRASIRINIDRDATDDRVSRFEGSIGAEDVALTARVEPMIAVFSEPTARLLTELRERFEPTGRASLVVELGGDDRGVDGASVLVTRTERAEAATPLGRMWVTHDAGELRFVPDIGEGKRGGLLTLTGVEGLVGRGPDAASTARAEGRWRIEAQGTGSGAVTTRLSGARAEHPLTRDILRRALPEAILDDFERLDPSGGFSADLDLRWESDGPLRVAGTCEPGAMEISRGERRIAVERESGALRLMPTDRGSIGRFESMRFRMGREQDRSLISLDGGWDAHDKDGSLGLTVTLDAPHGLGGDVLAMMPEPVSTSLEAASIRSDRAMRVRIAELDVRWSEDRPASFELSGRADVEGVSAQVGASITDLDGALEFTASGDGDAARFAVDIAADRMRLSGVRATDATVSITQGGEGELLGVPEIRADVHGGKLYGTARLLEDDRAVDEPAERGPEFEADLRLAAVAFAEVLEDLSSSESDGSKGSDDGAGRIGEIASVEDAQALRDRSRGLADARLGLTGRVGEQSTTSGRGSVVIGGGRIIDLPLVVRLVQVSNLETPSNDPIDLAEATFIVQGDRLRFEKLSVYTPSVEIAGYGSMRWTDQELDLRFGSRRVRRIPLVSEALERFRDEIVKTRVSGTLANPTVSLTQFSATRKLFARLLGETDDDAALRLDRARRLAERRDRIRRVDEQASRVLQTPAGEDG